MVRLIIAAAIACGCSGKGASAPEPQGVAESLAAEGAADRAEPAVPDAGPPVDEVVARALLAERFRAAGLRIRYDVRVHVDGEYDVTVDGYDPEREVGYEYIDAAEVGVDLDDAERAAIAGDTARRILVIDAADQATVTARADAFLRALADAEPARTE